MADWTALKLEYVNGSMSLRELADKHDIKSAGVMKRAASEGWDDERKQISAKVSAEAQAILDEQRPNELARFNEDDLRVAKAIRSQVATHISKAQQDKRVLSANELRTLAGAAEAAQKMGRLALGVTTNNTGLSNPDGTPINPPSFVVDWGDDGSSD